MYVSAMSFPSVFYFFNHALTDAVLFPASTASIPNSTFSKCILPVTFVVKVSHDLTPNPVSAHIKVFKMKGHT